MGVESGGKRRQIRRPFHPDVQIPRLVGRDSTYLTGDFLLGNSSLVMSSLEEIMFQSALSVRRQKIMAKIMKLFGN
jgi:hypothetical protein